MLESSHESHGESHAGVTVFESSTMYWKLCSMVLGVGFVIAVASHGGARSAGAGEFGNDGNLLSFHQKQASAILEADATQTLSIGGFDSIDGEAMFVIVNEDGQRVGALPMDAGVAGEADE